MKKQLFVFDVAGTLVDLFSKAPLIAFHQAFSEFDLYPNEMQMKASMGKNKFEHIQDILKELDISDDHITDDIYKSLNRHIVDAAKHTNEPIEGVLEALEKLNEEGHKVAFTTGYNRTTANIALERLDNKLSFTPPLTTSSDCPGRPTPHMIYRSMLLTKTNNVRDVWKIGDTIADCAAGHAAGLNRDKIIIVPTGNYVFPDDMPHPGSMLDFVNGVIENGESWYEV